MRRRGLSLVEILIAIVLLGIVGVYLTARLGSEGSTHRGSEASEWWGRKFDALKAKFGRGTA